MKNKILIFCSSFLLTLTLSCEKDFNEIYAIQLMQGNFGTWLFGNDFNGIVDNDEEGINIANKFLQDG